MTILSGHDSRALIGGAAAALVSARADAQAYPNRPITIVVPWAPGGSTDILARAVGEELRRSLQQTIIVDNRPGASGNIGSGVVAKATPDGYTILFGVMTTHTVNEALFATMPFRGIEDFTPIAVLAYVLNTMVIHPSVPAKTVKEFIDYAKANPGKISYASAGAGSHNHLCAALLEQMTGIKMVHVPYRGGAPAVADTVAGHTQLLFTAGTQSLPHVKDGRLRLLAVTESKRSTLLPDVPTVSETLPGFELAVWYGSFGPVGLPDEIVKKLNAEINRALFQPGLRKKMADIGVEVVNEPPATMARMLRADREMLIRIVKQAGIGTQ